MRADITEEALPYALAWAAQLRVGLDDLSYGEVDSLNGFARAERERRARERQHRQWLIAESEKVR